MTTPTGPQAQEAGISDLLALSENATPGPWIVESEDQGHPSGLEWCVRSPDAADEDYTGWIGRSDDGDNTVISTGCPGDRRDAEFICAAVNWFRANAATLATPARVVSDADEGKAYSDWFFAEQGKAYDGMWQFARAAWMARAALSTLQSGAEGKDGDARDAARYRALRTQAWTQLEIESSEFDEESDALVALYPTSTEKGHD